MTSTSSFSCLSGEISARDTFLLCKVINKEGERGNCGERGEFCKEWEEERNTLLNEEGPREKWVDGISIGTMKRVLNLI